MALFMLPVVAFGAYLYFRNKERVNAPVQQLKQSTSLSTPPLPTKKPVQQSNFLGFSFDSILADLRSQIGNTFGGITTTQNATVQYYPKQIQNLPQPKSQSPNALLELIGQKESGGDYNILYGGKRINLVGMSVNQVLEYQRLNNPAGAATAAAGKYQIIRKTLTGLKSEMRLTGNELFNQYMQDKMAIHLLNRRGLQKYLSGSLSEAGFMRNLSMEWASFPKDYNGRSYYAGDGVNKAGVAPQTVIAAMRRVKQTA